MKEFECDNCGGCCNNMNNVLSYNGSDEGIKKAVAEFPYKVIDGKCEMHKRNRCSVYKDRPLICRVNDFYKANPSVASTLEQWHTQHHDACGVFKRIAASKKRNEDNETLAIVNRSMVSLGYPLPIPECELIIKVYELARKKGNKINFQMLDDIKNEIFPLLVQEPQKCCNTYQAASPGNEVIQEELLLKQEIKN